jgi:hypothetical protein
VSLDAIVTVFGGTTRALVLTSDPVPSGRPVIVLKLLVPPNVSVSAPVFTVNAPVALL